MKEIEIPEIPKPKNEPLRIVKFSKYEIEFSNGAVIKSQKGRFDINIIEAIMKAGQ